MWPWVEFEDGNGDDDPIPLFLVEGLWGDPHYDPLPGELRGQEIGPIGHFDWEGEPFMWGPDTEWPGYTAVFDSQDFVVSVDRTPDIAIRGAIYELESLKESVNDFLSETMGWN